MIGMSVFILVIVLILKCVICGDIVQLFSIDLLFTVVFLTVRMYITYVWKCYTKIYKTFTHKYYVSIQIFNSPQ